MLHLHPGVIKTHALRPGFTWCMGGITFFLFLVETFTGVLLMFYYRPTIEWAYHDVLDLRDVVSLGVMREIHRWGGHAMVITVMLHMYRVFLTGSYKPPREFNWCLGVLLLVLTFALFLHRLPVAVGSVVVLGGHGRGEPGRRRQDSAPRRADGRRGHANRFYVLHCLGLPLAAHCVDGRSISGGCGKTASADHCE